MQTNTLTQEFASKVACVLILSFTLSLNYSLSVPHML